MDSESTREQKTSPAAPDPENDPASVSEPPPFDRHEASEEKRNMALLGSNMVISAAGNTMNQTMAFQLKLGMSTTQIGAMGLPGWLAGVVFGFASAFFADRVKDRVKTVSLLMLLSVLGPLTFVFIALGPEFLRKPDNAMICIICTGVLCVIFSSVMNIIVQAVYARSLRNEIKGRFFGLTGTITGIIGMGTGALATLILKYIPYPYNFAFCFGVTALSIVVCSFIVRKVRELKSLDIPPEAEEKSVPEKKKTNFITDFCKIAKMREFKLLMPANLLRGLGDGIGGYVIAVGMKNLDMGVELAGYMSMIVSGAGLLAGAMIGFIADKFGAGRVILLFDVFLCTAMITMATVFNPWVFLGAYLVYWVMLIMEGYAIPLVHYNVVPLNVFGAFSSVRLTLLGLSNGLSMFLVGWSLDVFPVLIVFGVCAGFKIVAGIMYFIAQAALAKNTVSAK